MIRTSLLVAVLASTLAATPPSSTPAGNASAGTSPSAPPPPPPMAEPSAVPASQPVDAALLARAKASFAQLQAGNVDKTTLTTQMSTLLTSDKQAQVKTAIGGLGAPTSFDQQKTGVQNGQTYGIYLVQFPNGSKVDFIFVVDGQGKISGMQLVPPQ